MKKMTYDVPELIKLSDVAFGKKLCNTGQNANKGCASGSYNKQTGGCNDGSTNSAAGGCTFGSSNSGGGACSGGQLNNS